MKKGDTTVTYALDNSSRLMDPFLRPNVNQSLNQINHTTIITHLILINYLFYPIAWTVAIRSKADGLLAVCCVVTVLFHHLFYIILFQSLFRLLFWPLVYFTSLFLAIHHLRSCHIVVEMYDLALLAIIPGLLGLS